ncbi:UNVERIFIED_CONTAM: hypothetical protein Sradi_4657100 [Sesamum radiatum]|uniref:Uncharacterized protein n=3 Tax=Sesamum TaxID=4181 RepID=A0AAW2NDZ7_SESRA
MEGLIPMVYKSVKKNMTRRHYECLSSGAAAHPAYNIPDHHDYFNRKLENINKDSGLHGARHHRRYNSVHVVGRVALEEEEEEKAAPPSKPKQLVRFRSHKMFSCVTGA